MKRPNKAKAKPGKSKPARKPPSKPRTRKAAPRPAARTKARAEYAAIKEAARSRRVEISATGRDIGPLPPAADPRRKAACERNFRRFCETYCSDLFTLAWSDDHLKVIAKIERAVLEGGCFAVAMPRGSGKSTLCECACIWAACYGHRRFILLIGADLGHAVDMLASIKSEFAHNERLAADFPEICVPVGELGGITQRCKGQLCDGKPTEIAWRDRVIVLPWIEGSKASGVILKAAGLTAAIRGMKHKRPDGTAVRPDLVIPDDPQTDQSARSPRQVERRLALLAGAILELAGPGQKISAIMPLTVIQADDVADQILDAKTHPEWQGERLKAVYAFPTDVALWDEFLRIRQEDLRAGGRGAAATAFYRKHRAAMDAGAVVAWPERYNEDELSAVQHNMVLKLTDPATFASERQNEPLKDERKARALTREEIFGKQNGLPRGRLLAAQNVLTAFVDVHKELLYWAACAWEADFTGHLVSYGTFPEQPIGYFSLDAAPHKLEEAFRRSGQVGATEGGEEGAIFWGLGQVAELLCSGEWIRDDGLALPVKLVLVDANWKTRLVKQFCRQSRHSARLLASHGRYVGAAKKSLGEYRPARGDRVGDAWRITRAEDLPVRHVLFDANYWKSQVATRWRVPVGGRTGLAVHDGDHRLLADHLSSEWPERVEGRGRVVDEWQLIPGRDNHWWDCLVGSTVAASIEGVAVPGMEVQRPPRPKRRFSELQRQKWGKRS